MIDHGAKIAVRDVGGWYDAGKLDTLLETNEAMLTRRGLARVPAGFSGATIIDPVYIEDGVTATNSTIGPNVSIGAGTVLDGATVRHAVIGTKATIRNATLHDSFLGDSVVVEGVSGAMTIGDHSEVRGG
jgi:glucose-1-phosphate thymidylyltransferase